MTPKLILGTAQFESGYGVTNGDVVLDTTTMTNIVDHAIKLGFSGVDTSPAYGSSQSILSKFCLDNLMVTSKFNFPDPDDADLISSALRKELEFLGLDFFTNLLTHDPGFLSSLRPCEINNVFERIRGSGIVNKIGMTLYSPDQLKYILESKLICDVIQVPANLLDQRFLNFDVLRSFREKGGVIQVRSIFLQGLLLAKDIPQKFLKFSNYFEKIDKYCSQHEIDPIQLTFSYLIETAMADEILLGVIDIAQLNQLHEKYSLAHANIKRLTTDYSKFGCWEDILINPSRWSAL